MAMDLREQAVGLINAAHVSADPTSELSQVHEILLDREPTLLPELFNAVCDFQLSQDESARVFTAAFVETVCRAKPQPQYLLRSAEVLFNLVGDQSSHVLLRVIRAAGEVMRQCIQVMCRSPASVTAEKARMWTMVSKIKDAIILKAQAGSMRSPFDGVRSQAVKFLESVVLLYSDTKLATNPATTTRSISSVDDVAIDHCLLSVDSLRAEGIKVLQILLGLLGDTTEKLSASNYQVLVTVLATIAKHRAVHLDLIVPGLLKTLLAPSHLTETGQQSLVHYTRLVLKAFLKLRDDHFARWQPVINDSLSGRSPAHPAAVQWTYTHRTKREVPEMDYDNSIASAPKPPYVIEAQRRCTQMGPGIIDLMLQSFSRLPSAPPAGASGGSQHPLLRLNPTDQGNVQTINRQMLPYIERMAQLASQPAEPKAVELVESKPEEEEVSADPRKKADPRKRRREESLDELTTSPTGCDVLSRPVVLRMAEASSAASQQASQPLAKRSKPSQPLPRIALLPLAHKDLQKRAWERLLAPECAVGATMAGATELRLGLVARLCVQQPLDGDFHEKVLGLILGNYSLYEALALSWLFQEFGDENMIRFAKDPPPEPSPPAFYDGMDEATKGVAAELARSGGQPEELAASALAADVSSDQLQELTTYLAKLDGSHRSRYETALMSILQGLSTEEGQTGGGLSSEAQTSVSSLLKHCPKVTSSAVALIQGWVSDFARIKVGLWMLKQLITDRPAIRPLCLKSLLSFTMHTEEAIREPTIRIVIRLYREKFCVGPITEFATTAFDSLLSEAVTAETASGMENWGVTPVVTPVATSDDEEKKDTRETMKRRTELYLAICTRDSSLIHRLLTMFMGGSDAVKAIILGLCNPKFWNRIRGTNADVLKLVADFPVEGIEFVLHMLGVFAELVSEFPAELIDTVKKVYRERISDVRLLVPFLHVHTREELVALLPKLVELLPTAGDDPQAKAKRNLFRDALMGLFSSSDCALPTEHLLIELHSINGGKMNRQTGTAIEVCLDDLSSMYDYRKLVKVLSKLVEGAPIAEMFMVTLARAVHFQPKLKEKMQRNAASIFERILQRCVERTIWEPRDKTNYVWIGFMRCIVQYATPTSPNDAQPVDILRSLPQAQLVDALKKTPALHPLFQANIAKLDAPAERWVTALKKAEPKKRKKPSQTADGGSEAKAAKAARAEPKQAAKAVEQAPAAKAKGDQDSSDDDIDIQL